MLRQDGLRVVRVVARLLLATLAAGAYERVLRPRMLNLGATADEIHDPFPGEEIVPGGRRGGTMAVTIDAPPSRVWPWLAQMGAGRAGWYSWDRLDNGGRPSAETLNPEWQHPAVGDRWASTQSGSAWFEVAALEPERFLALRAALDLRGRAFDTAARPRFYNDSVWSFLLRELPGARTRLVVSGYAAARPALLQALAARLFWEPAHLIMQSRQFRGIRRRAERLPPGGS